jgi:hypothetical protein
MILGITGSELYSLEDVFASFEEPPGDVTALRPVRMLT